MLCSSAKMAEARYHSGTGTNGVPRLVVCEVAAVYDNETGQGDPLKGLGDLEDGVECVKPFSLDANDYTAAVYGVISPAFVVLTLVTKTSPVSLTLVTL
jgi:hypothetical protein